MNQLGEFRQHFHLLEQSLRRLHIEKRGDAASHFVERIHFQCEIHSAFGADEIYGNWNVGAFGLFEQKCRASCFDDAVSDLRDFEDRIDFVPMRASSPAFRASPENPGDLDKPLLFPFEPDSHTIERRSRTL